MQKFKIHHRGYSPFTEEHPDLDTALESAGIEVGTEFEDEDPDNGDFISFFRDADDEVRVYVLEEDLDC